MATHHSIVEYLNLLNIMLFQEFLFFSSIHDVNCYENIYAVICELDSNDYISSENIIHSSSNKSETKKCLFSTSCVVLCGIFKLSTILKCVPLSKSVLNIICNEKKKN